MANLQRSYSRQPFISMVECIVSVCFLSCLLWRRKMASSCVKELCVLGARVRSFTPACSGWCSWCMPTTFAYVSGRHVISLFRLGNCFNICYVSFSFACLSSSLLSCSFQFLYVLVEIGHQRRSSSVLARESGSVRYHWNV